ETRRFHEPVRRSTVIVNNTTVINKTKVISNVREETKTFDGAAPRKVMVNEGPGLASIQAADRNVRVVALHDAVRKTPVPPTLERRMMEQKETQKPAPASE